MSKIQSLQKSLYVAVGPQQQHTPVAMPRESVAVEVVMNPGLGLGQKKLSVEMVRASPRDVLNAMISAQS